MKIPLDAKRDLAYNSVGDSKTPEALREIGRHVELDEEMDAESMPVN